MSLVKKWERRLSSQQPTALNKAWAYGLMARTRPELWSPLGAALLRGLSEQAIQSRGDESFRKDLMYQLSSALQRPSKIDDMALTVIGATYLVPRQSSRQVAHDVVEYLLASTRTSTSQKQKLLETIRPAILRQSPGVRRLTWITVAELERAAERSFARVLYQYSAWLLI